MDVDEEDVGNSRKTPSLQAGAPAWLTRSLSEKGRRSRVRLARRGAGSVSADVECRVSTRALGGGCRA